MDHKRLILRNTLSNIGMQVIVAGLPFLLLPYMLRYWGTDAYGILVLALSVQSFVFFLNAAIHLTLMKYVSEVYEVKDHERLNTIINIFRVVAFLNNLAVSLVLIGVGIFGLHWFNVPPVMLEMARNVLLIMGGCGIVAGLFSFIDGVMYGLQKIQQSNLFGVCEAILIAATAVVVIYVNETLATYVLAISVFPIISRAGQLVYLKRLLPEFRLDVRRYFDLQELRRLSKFSGYQILNQVSDTLMYNAHKLIIQKVMGPTSLTMYEIANKPNLLFQNFISLPLSAILPACSAAYARGDMAFLEKMLIMGSRIYLVLVLPGLFAFILLMRQFITLWLGEDYLPAVPAAQLFLCALMISCPFKIFSHMMVGKGRVFEYGVTKFAYALLSVPVSIFAITRFGIIGGVAVTFCYWILVNIPTHLYVMWRENISALHLLRNILPLLSILVIEYLLISGALHLRPGSTWVELIGLMGLGVLSATLAALFLILRKEERALVGLKF